MKAFSLLSTIIFICQFSFAQGDTDDLIRYYCPPCNAACDDLSFDEAGTCTHCGMTLLGMNSTQRENMLRVVDMTIGFYLQDGVEVLDFAGPMEVFSYAGFKIVTIARTKEPIISQGILKIIPDYSITSAPKIDILATFGGNARRGFNDSTLIEWVKEQDVSMHFSVCTGAFLFAKAGILDGLKATTFHSAVDNLAREFPNVEVLEGVRYVDNGNVITTAGISAGIDGALHLVHKLLGLDAAKSIANNMEYDKWIPEEGLIVRP